MGRIPSGHRVYAIGDIHGRADLLCALHDMVREDAAHSKAKNRIIYLGDYIDRGPNSFDVVEELLTPQLDDFSRIFIKGNHEDMMLTFLEAPTSLHWLDNGGLETISSYGVDVPRWCFDVPDLDALRDAFAGALPPHHKAFFHALLSRYDIGTYVFVHAGINPKRPINAQLERDMLWIRGAFLNCWSDFGRVIVHGHSISPEPVVTGNRIGIDTGAFRSNRLTCVVLEESTVRFLQT